jgi:hypothetical protein
MREPSLTQSIACSRNLEPFGKACREHHVQTTSDARSSNDQMWLQMCYKMMDANECHPDARIKDLHNDTKIVIECKLEIIEQSIHRQRLRPVPSKMKTLLSS